mgnify:FL=1
MQRRRAPRPPIVYVNRSAECVTCGVTYERTGQSQRYCSPECRGAIRLVPNGKRKYRVARHEEKTCEGCGVTYVPSSSYQRYCTTRCRETSQKVAGTCENCGAEFLAVHGQRFCGMNCKYSATVGDRRVVDGYVLLRVPKGTPGARGSQPWIPEHRYVMQQSLGRPLDKDETVHHINGDKTDNRLANLQLRQGRHGKGARLVCLDCGSHNVTPVDLH